MGCSAGLAPQGAAAVRTVRVEGERKHGRALNMPAKPAGEGEEGRNGLTRSCTQSAEEKVTTEELQERCFYSQIRPNSAGLHWGQQPSRLCSKPVGLAARRGGSAAPVVHFLFKKLLAAGRDQVITLPLFTSYLRIVTDHTPRR